MEKRKIWAIVLLVLMYMSTAGNYLSIYENAMFVALIEIIICSIILMAVPLCFRIKNKELLSYEQGKKICTYNSWIIFGISILMMMIFEGIGIVGGVGALCYYFINMAFFTYPKDYKKDDTNKSRQEEIKMSLSFENEKVEKDPRLTYGEDVRVQKTVEQIEEKQLDNLIEKLQQEKEEIAEPIKTVEKIVEIKEDKTFLYVIIGILAVAVIGIGIYAFNLNDKMVELEEEYSSDLAEQIINSVKADFLDENIVFVIDGYGDYYYTYDQMEIVTQGIDEYSCWAYNKEQAIAKGYKAWK